MSKLTFKPFRPLFPAVAIMAAIALGGCGSHPSATTPETIQPQLSLGGVDDARPNDAGDAYQLYRTAASTSEQRKWICIAVNRGQPEAQAELARLHWPRPGAPRGPFRQDMTQAYAWSLIAVSNGEPLEYMEERLKSAMTPEEQWKATKLAALWKPDPTDCGHIDETGCLHAQ